MQNKNDKTEAESVTQQTKRIINERNKRILNQQKTNLYKLLKEAAFEGVITCPQCGRSLEPDADECPCGWKNVLVEGGWI